MISRGSRSFLTKRHTKIRSKDSIRLYESRKAQRLPPLTKTRSSGLSHFPWKYRRTISSSIEQTAICTIAIFTISVTEACQYITSITVGYRNKHFDVTLYAELTAHTDMCSIDICIPLLILRIFISIHTCAYFFI